MDIEKVSNGLCNAIGIIHGYVPKRYWGYGEQACRDAIALLKEQEAVEPRRIDGKRNHFIKCGNCNYDLLTGYMFCPHCGRAVKCDA